MATNVLVPLLTDLLEPQAIAAGLELVAVEVAGEKQRPLIRVFLDAEGGITIDAIAQASHWIRDTLDAAPFLGDEYILEASSPGIDRPLRTLADFARFAGSQAKVTTRQAVDGRKHFIGTILGVEADAIRIDVDGISYTIPFGELDKARLRVEIDFSREVTDGI